MKSKATLFIFLWFAPLAAQHLDAREIIQTLDELYRTQSSYAEMEMNIITPHWQRTLRMKVWSQGTDKTFIRIIEPKKEAGVATLRIGNEMWNYLPKTSKVIKIPPSMMMSSWMGSDFNNDDLVNEFSLLEDYQYEIIHPDTARDTLVYLKCTPKTGLPIVWAYLIVSVREKDYLPVQENYYDEKDNLMRIIKFREIKVFDNRRIPSVMELIPQEQERHRTTLKYLDAEFNLAVEDETFTLRNLRSRD